MKIENAIEKYRWPIVAVFIAVTLFMGIQLRKIVIEADVETLLPENMSSRVDTRKIEEVFGRTDMLFFVFESDDVLAEKTLRRLKKLDKEMSRIKGVSDIMSLFSAKNITGEDGAMIVDPAVKRIPKTVKAREKLRQELRENELVYEMIVSRDFKQTMLMLSLKADAVEADVYRDAMACVEKNPGDEKVYTGGQPAFRATIRNDIIKDIVLLIPAALLVMLGVLFVFFRQKRGVALPFVTVVLSTLFGVALLPLIGWSFTLISVLLPIMVVGIANNYGIHLVAKYQELNELPGEHTAIGLAAEVFRRLWKPVLITGLTTIVGILGLLSHVMVPAKQIGIAAAIAIAFALALSLLAIPSVLSMMKIPKRRHEGSKHNNDGIGRILNTVGHNVVTRPGIILIISAVITALAVAGTFLVQTDANQENLFSPSHPISQCTRLINDHFGGTQNISVLIEGDVKDPSLLKRVEGYQDKLEKTAGVGQTNSMADVIRIMSKALNDKDEAGYNRIPSSREAIAQYFEFYSMSGDPEDFERLVDFNYEKTHLIARINNGSTPVVKSIADMIEQFAKSDTSIKAVGGYAIVMTELAETILNGQVLSLLAAIGAISLLMMFLFRSFYAGILSAVPLSVSILFGFGVMGLFGINLDMATAMITSIVIGAGVDYTIHFLWRYRDERREGRSYREAVLNTINTTGRGIVFNAFSVVAGFAALFLSNMPPLRSFALLFSISILSCMVGAMVIVPSICLLIKPRFLEPGAEKNK